MLSRSALCSLCLLAGCAALPPDRYAPVVEASPVMKARPPAAAPGDALVTAAPAPAAAPAPPPMAEPAPPLASTLRFGRDMYKLSPEHRELLAPHAEVLKADPSRRLLVEGHAETGGAPAYNLALAAKRAETVVRALLAMGVPASQLAAVPRGAPRQGPAQASDRRVQLVHVDASAPLPPMAVSGSRLMASPEGAVPPRVDAVSGGAEPLRVQRPREGSH